MFKVRHEADSFNGEGARLVGGRWNRAGTAVVYAAGSASLAVLEKLVHLASHEILEAYLLCQVTFDQKLVNVVNISDLPSGWQDDPGPEELKQLGDEWVRQQLSAILRVPSVIIETEFNYLLNPAHPDFRRITIGAPVPFRFDSRLLK